MLKINIRELIDYIKNNQPIHISELLNYIQTKYNVHRTTGSIKISELVKMGKLERTGLRNSWIIVKTKKE